MTNILLLVPGPKKFDMGHDHTRDSHFTECWVLMPKNKNYPRVYVDYDREKGRAYCCRCQGLVTAQLTTCVHARTVARWAAKSNG